tara:strand:+ start:74739 stop:75857 length:1119 start_codon:yes stop_codon:yes gene_type:complete
MNRESRFNRWIFHSFPVTEEGLGLMRIVLSIFLLFFLIPGEGIDHFSFLSNLPSDFYAAPPGPMMLIDQFPSFTILVILHSACIAAVFLMLIGYRTKTVSIVAGISILLLQGVIFSIGKINHEILIASVPIIMAFSNWGAAYSFDSRREEKLIHVKSESWPLTFIAVLIGFMMFTAGFPKILGGWLDFTTQATEGHLLNQYYVRGRQDLLAGAAVNFHSTFFWELLDWGTVLFEIGFLFALFKREWVKFFLSIAVLFHFSTMITLNIAFLPNFLAYAIFLNWDGILSDWQRWYQKITGGSGKLFKQKSVIVLAMLLIFLFGALKMISMSDQYLNQSDLRIYEVVIVGGAAFYVIYLGIKNLMNLDKSILMSS